MSEGGNLLSHDAGTGGAHAQGRGEGIETYQACVSS